MAQKLKYPVQFFELSLKVREATDTEKTLLDFADLVIKSPTDIDRLLPWLRQSSEERFIALHLNSRHRVVGIHVVSHGTISSSLVHPREVFKAAMLNNSYAIIMVHNHPSGEPLEPSMEDIDTTEKMITVGASLGISVVDHVIVSPTHSAYSIRENKSYMWRDI